MGLVLRYQGWMVLFPAPLTGLLSFACEAKDISTPRNETMVQGFEGSPRSRSLLQRFFQ